VSNLVVIVFNDEHQAGQALATLRGLEHQGAIQFDDTAVLSKAPDGKLHVKNEVSSATETGAVVGGMLGLLMTFLFPGVGILIGAAGGAAVGALLDQGIDRSFVKELSESLQPGSSALFLLVKHAQPAVVDALKPYHGSVYQTTLPEDVEERLARALA
jgi:uncharacterized membrane protein